MNKFILNDAQTTKTNGPTADEVLHDRITRGRTEPLLLSLFTVLILDLLLICSLNG